MKPLCRLEARQTKRRLEQSQKVTTRMERDLAESRSELATVTEQLDSLRHRFQDHMESFVGGKVNLSR